MKVACEGKKFEQGTKQIFTYQGERVRSKSEKIIADALYRKQVAYKYECPLIINGLGKVYPDFTILNVQQRKEIYWEHFGMMDNTAYCEKAVYKINCYQKAGFYIGEQLILTFETAKNPLDTELVEHLIMKQLC